MILYCVQRRGLLLMIYLESFLKAKERNSSKLLYRPYYTQSSHFKFTIRRQQSKLVFFLYAFCEGSQVLE